MGEALLEVARTILEATVHDYEDQYKKAASLELLHSRSAAFFEEPTYLSFVNALMSERFQFELRRPSPGNATLAGCLFQPALRGLVFGKAPFVQAEFVGMIIAPPINHASRVLDVEHLVIQDVFDKPFRHLRRIE
jgi:hypothetical protein